MSTAATAAQLLAAYEQTASIAVGDVDTDGDLDLIAGGSITVPNAPSLVGLAIYSQALLAAYPNSLRLSNVVRDVVTR